MKIKKEEEEEEEEDIPNNTISFPLDSSKWE